MFSSLRLRDMFSPQRRMYTKALLRFCIETMTEVANYEYANVGKDFQLCTGAVYILIKVVGYIMKDLHIAQEFLWTEQPSDNNVALGIKLANATLLLLFKPGYTIR